MNTVIQTLNNSRQLEVTTGGYKTFKEVTSVEVHGINIYRHAGDSALGNDDSWFVIADVCIKATFDDGTHAANCRMHLKSAAQHGMSLPTTENLALRILRKRTIDLNLWVFD